MKHKLICVKSLTCFTTYVSGTSGYNIWSNGLCQQWGYTKAGTTITFAKKFKDANYNISTGICSASGDTQPTELKIKTKTATQLAFNQAYNNTTAYNQAS